VCVLRERANYICKNNNIPFRSGVLTVSSIDKSDKQNPYLRLRVISNHIALKCFLIRWHLVTRLGKQIRLQANQDWVRRGLIYY